MRSPAQSLSLALTVILITSQTGCGILDSDEGVSLRVQNSGTIAFDEITFYTPDGPRVYDGLDPLEGTPYFAVSRAYGTATTEVVAGFDTLRLQVIDYVGDPPLEPGRYTFLIRVVYEGNEGHLEQTVRRD